MQQRSQKKVSKRRDMKIMFLGNASWSNSGYGQFLKDLLRRMKADGWPIAQTVNVGLGGSPIEHEGYPNYPGLLDQWGNDALFYHSKHFGANLAFIMLDTWVLNPQFLQMLNQEKIPIVMYIPIDQDPINSTILNNLRYAYKIITFSEYGRKQLEKEGFASEMIYEGVDTNVFKPLDKAAVRKEFNFPQDKFIFGMIGANKENPPRKAWQQALEAFKLFHDKHPDSVFYFHSNQNLPSGFPVIDFANRLGIGQNIAKMDDYMALVHTGPEQINKLLNCFDCLLHPSATEGFGLVVPEAQAAQTPAIVNRSQSQPELLIEGESGFICEPGYEWFSPAQGYWRFPDTQSLYEQMEKVFAADREKMGKKARENVLEKFDIDKIFRERWIPTFNKLQDELLPATELPFKLTTAKTK